MHERIRKLDHFSRNFSFNARRGSKHFKTAIGGFITIKGQLLLFTIALIIFQRYRDTTKPVVSVNKVRLKTAPKLDLLKHNIRLRFAILNASTVLNGEEIYQYFTFRGEFATRTKAQDGTYREEIQPVDVRSCRDNQAPATNSSSLFSNSTICSRPRPEDWYIAGSSSSLPNRRYVIKIYPCSLPDRSQCASLYQLSLTIIGNLPSYKIANYSNKKDPLIPVLDVDNGNYIGLASKTVITTYYKENFIFDNDLDFSAEKLKFSYIDVDIY